MHSLPPLSPQSVSTGAYLLPGGRYQRHIIGARIRRSGYAGTAYSTGFRFVCLLHALFTFCAVLCVCPTAGCCIGR